MLQYRNYEDVQASSGFGRSLLVFIFGRFCDRQCHDAALLAKLFVDFSTLLSKEDNSKLFELLPSKVSRHNRPRQANGSELCTVRKLLHTGG